MNKMLVMVVIFIVLLSGCLPAAPQPETINPTPLSETDLQATAAILSEQTLQALPTQTVVPSNTAPAMTPTKTLVPTETQNPILLTLTATMGTGTVAANNQTSALNGTTSPGGVNSTSTASITANPAFSATPSGTAHAQFNGTQAPNLPFNTIMIFNKAKVDVYISLRCTTKDGYVTILEYPVKSNVQAKAPVGKYTYVAWVGGRQFTGAFSLTNDRELVINIFKDRIGIK